MPGSAVTEANRGLRRLGRMVAIMRRGGAESHRVGWVERSETHRTRRLADGFRFRSTHPTRAAAQSTGENMFTRKVGVQERERRRVLHERSGGSGQRHAIAMFGWSA